MRKKDMTKRSASASAAAGLHLVWGCQCFDLIKLVNFTFITHCKLELILLSVPNIRK